METGEEKLLKKAQGGMSRALSALEEKEGKILSVANWFLSQSLKEEPVTHLALQKLLYFVQSWSAVLLDMPLFYDDCQAWAHGAVYPKVYDIFKRFQYDPLPKVKESFALSENELKLLEAVKKYYSDRYSAKALEEICHREEPYIKARKGCRSEEAGCCVIEKEEICSYYRFVSQKYNISLNNMSNIRDYLNMILNH